MTTADMHDLITD